MCIACRKPKLNCKLHVHSPALGASLEIDVTCFSTTQALLEVRGLGEVSRGAKVMGSVYDATKYIRILALERLVVEIEACVKSITLVVLYPKLVDFMQNSHSMPFLK